VIDLLLFCAVPLVNQARLLLSFLVAMLTFFKVLPGAEGKSLHTKQLVLESEVCVYKIASYMYIYRVLP